MKYQIGNCIIRSNPHTLFYDSFRNAIYGKLTVLWAPEEAHLKLPKLTAEQSLGGSLGFYRSPIAPFAGGQAITASAILPPGGISNSSYFARCVRAAFNLSQLQADSTFIVCQEDINCWEDRISEFFPALDPDDDIYPTLLECYVGT